MNVSVVIPTYKRPQMLSCLLETLAQQTVLPCEVVVVDDCSQMDQEYLDVIEQFKPLFNQLHYYSLDANSGAPTARNYGISKSSGDWIALVDDDDQWYEDKLAKQINLLLTDNRQDKIGLVYTWVQVYDEHNTLLETSSSTLSGDVRSALLKRNFILSPSVLVRKQALVEVGGFDVHLKSCQDWDTWIKVAVAGYEFRVVPEYLALYRKHNCGSIGLSPKATYGYIQVLQKNFKNIFKYSPVTNWVSKLWLYIKMTYRFKVSS